MPNRQHSRPSRSSAGRSPAAGRTARAVSVSRTPGTPVYTEPEVRRWPHPLEDGAASPAPEPAMHYIRCALSYQNQLLADIKVLLEQMTVDRASGTPPPDSPLEPEKGGENLSKL
jgi:hypothetical protein